MVIVPVWVRPGSGADSLGWDPWRSRWVVGCTARPVGGAANHAVAGLIARWLDVPMGSVRWVTSGTSRAKLLSIEGLTDSEIADRLRVVAARPASCPDGRGIHRP